MLSAGTWANLNFRRWAFFRLRKVFLILSASPSLHFYSQRRGNSTGGNFDAVPSNRGAWSSKYLCVPFFFKLEKFQIQWSGQSDFM